MQVFYILNSLEYMINQIKYLTTRSLNNVNKLCYIDVDFVGHFVKKSLNNIE